MMKSQAVWCQAHETVVRAIKSSLPTEQQLLARIRELEEQNSALQDKLDEIWAVLAPVYEPDDDLDDSGLIQIQGPGTPQ